jgi:hypothetical protein
MLNAPSCDKMLRHILHERTFPRSTNTSNPDSKKTDVIVATVRMLQLLGKLAETTRGASQSSKTTQKIGNSLNLYRAVRRPSAPSRGTPTGVRPKQGLPAAVLHVGNEVIHRCCPVCERTNQK